MKPAPPDPIMPLVRRKPRFALGAATVEEIEREGHRAMREGRLQDVIACKHELRRREEAAIEAVT